ncbi:anti-sigma factor antagonist [Patescibacteria group bacterium]|nr:anti-sigma factor antagonist [Patescibacteria group bacterium]MBU1682578.1 anti-sigma factor antagonist [Patescibacteria group bacterium]MBU1935731.1 anti-sigma factor antagonist [Patescibacteria group bacterium]
MSFSSLVRHISEEVFNFIGFGKEWCNRLKLVVDELFMNAVRYGSTADTSTVHVFFSYNDEEVEFSVEDDGSGTRKMSADELKALINKNVENNNVTQTSGRGLALIAKLWTDHLDIKQSSFGGLAISFSKHIETAPPPPPPLVQTVIYKPSKSISEATKESKGPDFTVKLHGEIDQANIDAVTLPIDEQITALPESARLILDFGDVDYINSTFIGHLASWHNDVQKKGGQIVLKNVNDQIRDVLDLVGLEHVLTINK